MALRFWSSPSRRAVVTRAITPSRSVVARRAIFIVATTVLVDLAVITLAYWAGGASRSRLHELPTKEAILATIPCWVVVFFVCGLYSRRMVLEPAVRISALVAALASSILLTIVIAFVFAIDLSRGWVISVSLFAAAFVLAGRFGILALTRYLNERNWLGLRTVVVGDNGEARTLARVLRSKRYLGYDVIGFVSTREGEAGSALATVEGIREMVIAQDIAAVFVAGSDVGPDVLTRIDKSLVGLAVRIRTSLGLPHLAASRVVVQSIDGMAMLAVERIQPSDFQLRLKRGLDVALSTLGLLAGLPLVLGIALAIKLTSEGPVIFTQRRVGAGGQFFTMYKFRTMVKDAELRRAELMQRNEADGVLFKMRKDPRMTAVGRQLRKLGLDELPQLFNILIGEMSMVGPRPAMPEEMEHWTPDLSVRLNAKPGLTGLWQVSGRHELAFEDYVRYDLFYVENWSLMLDLQILLRTIPAVLSRAGSY